MIAIALNLGQHVDNSRATSTYHNAIGKVEHNFSSDLLTRLLWSMVPNYNLIATEHIDSHYDETYEWYMIDNQYCIQLWTSNVLDGITIIDTNSGKVLFENAI